MDAFQREQDRIATETQALSARAEPEPDLQLAPTVVERAFAIIDNIAEAYLRANERERAMWNEAVFTGIWVGDREIKRTEYRNLFASILSDTSSNWVSLVAPAGFEPAVSALRGLRPSPLDDGATFRWDCRLTMLNKPGMPALPAARVSARRSGPSVSGLRDRGLRIRCRWRPRSRRSRSSAQQLLGVREVPRELELLAERDLLADDAEQLARHQAAPCESPPLLQAADERRQGGGQDHVAVEAKTSRAHHASDPDEQRLDVVNPAQQPALDGGRGAEDNDEQNRAF